MKSKDSLDPIVEAYKIFENYIEISDRAFANISFYIKAISERLDAFETRLLYVEKLVSDREIVEEVFRQ